MRDKHDAQRNRAQLELHLKSAVESLTPNVLDRIDLSAPQEPALDQGNRPHGDIIRIHRRMRGFALAAAACLCITVMGGGAAHYQYQNRKIDSVIGIDVNPSVELSINRKNKVLSADALNAEAQVIIADMDLTGVDLNVAVNAVIGSMVTQGYLDDLDNAILVTVSNDSIKKATELRTSVVGDIEKTLKENQVQAVVYDQQVVERDEMKLLAETYGISYGKAYFLKELIEQNKELTMDDMEALSGLSMEEIARRITDSSYALGQFAEKAEETTNAPVTKAETSEAESTTQATTQATTAELTTEVATVPVTQPATTAAPATTAPETEEVTAGRVEIDYVDYEDGRVYVYFVTRVKWKNPTVSVKDEDGNSYAALVEETSGSECVIEVSGLEGGRSYSFVLGGLTPAEGGSATTVRGYFDKPEIAGGAINPDWTEDEDDGTDETPPEIPATDVPATDAPTTQAPTTGVPTTEAQTTSGQKGESKPARTEQKPAS